MILGAFRKFWDFRAKLRKSWSGFSLIELLIVMAIIGIMATAVVLAINPNKRLGQARDAARKQDLSQIYNALVAYFTEKGTFPGAGADNAANSQEADWLSDLKPDHLKTIPKDPKQAGVGQVAGVSVPSKGNSYNMPVLVLKYFPTVDGVNVDSGITGVVSSLANIRTKVNRITTETQAALQAGSTYHGYKDAGSTPALNYSIIDQKEYLATLPIGIEVPWKPGQGYYRPDYGKILTDLNICNYVNNQGLKEVWLYGWHWGNIEPAESVMSGPYGDISNSGGGNFNMPVCSKSYVLYNYSYGRDTSEAAHDHGHQIEIMMKNVGDPLFENKFIGPFSTYGANDGSGTNFHRCGWTHTPPNTGGDYDYSNTRYSWTDCENWSSDGSGAKVNINCNTWQCNQIGYHIWRWQNIPGKNNSVLGASNWWDFIGDFDRAKSIGEKLIYDVTAPSVPTGLVASNIYSTQLSLSWSASSDLGGVARYQIKRNGQAVGTTSITAFTDYAVSAEITYQYTVSAVDTLENTSAESTPLSVTTTNVSAPGASRPILDSYTYKNGNGAISYSWQHTVGNGSNRFLIVGVGVRSGVSVQVSGVTYKDIPLVNLGFRDNGGLRTEFWTLKNPDTGLNPITVTLTGSPDGSIGGASSWLNVDQTNPTGVAESNAGTSFSSSVGVTTLTSDVVVDSLVLSSSALDAPPAAISGQIIYWNLTSSGDTRAAGSSRIGANKRTGMSWNFTKNTAFAIIAVPIKYGVTPVPTPTPVLTPTPVPEIVGCPQVNGVYCYVVSPTGDRFTLWGKLEDPNDPEIWDKPDAHCRQTPPYSLNYNYCLAY